MKVHATKVCRTVGVMEFGLKQIDLRAVTLTCCPGRACTTSGAQVRERLEPRDACGLVDTESSSKSAT